jgi:hypothetical protein
VNLNNSLIMLDPSDERTPVSRSAAPRLGALTGKTVGLLDISKARGDVFLDRIEERLAERGVNVERFKKPTFARVAPIDLRQEIAARCDAVIEALAD